MDTDRTRTLFAPLIQRPTLTDQLLQRPPFKFLHDIVRETLQATGFPSGLFTDDELDSTKAGASRDNKVAFLQKLIDVLNVDGNLDDVKPAKIVAGKEAELTNLLLQSLASEATAFVQHEKEKRKTAKKSSSTKSKSSSNSSSKVRNNDENEAKVRKSNKEKKTSSKIPSLSSTSTKSRSKEGEVISTNNEAKKKSSSKSNSGEKLSLSSKDKERRKKHSDSASRSKLTTATKNADEQQPSTATFIMPPTEHQSNNTNVNAVYNTNNLINTNLPDSRRTPPDRESSGGTSKGGDDSGIAEETGAESERHDLSESYGMVTHSGLTAAQRHEASKNSIPDFIEVHAPSPVHSSQPPFVRPSTAIGRPQTAFGRPGTAVARPAPPKPKKNIIASNLNAEYVEPKQVENQFQLILEDNKQSDEKNATEQSDNFLVEEEDEQLLIENGIASDGGANIARLQEGDEHGLLVNKIIENTRELEREHLHENDTFVDGETFDVHEQRRIRMEIELTQKALKQTTQLVQPFQRTLEFVIDDFDAMLRDLEDCRKQTAQLERQLTERQAHSGAETTKMDSALRQLDNDIKYTQEQIAITTATILRNEKKISDLLELE